MSLENPPKYKSNGRVPRRERCCRTGFQQPDRTSSSEQNRLASGAALGSHLLRAILSTCPCRPRTSCCRRRPRSASRFDLHIVREGPVLAKLDLALFRRRSRSRAGFESTAQQTVGHRGIRRVAGAGGGDRVVGRFGHVIGSVNPWPTLDRVAFAISSRSKPEQLGQSKTRGLTTRRLPSAATPIPFRFSRRFRLSAIR